ncbi:MAG: PilZ domain-containing protein [Xanthobacteraceae bacterium]
MTWGDRRSERVSFAEGLNARSMGVDGTWQRACTLLDISATGARLQVEGSIDVMHKREFFLILSSTGLVFRRCELVRVKGDEIGIRFVTEKLDKKAKGRVVAEAP